MPLNEKWRKWNEEQERKFWEQWRRDIYAFEQGFGKPSPEEKYRRNYDKIKWRKP